MLKTGAILNFLVAAGHLACLPWLYPVLSIYRIDGIMETLALRYGAAIPYLLTVAIAFIFAVFGLYGLSGAGIIRRLPRSKQVFTPLPPSSCCGPSRALRKWP